MKKFRGFTRRASELSVADPNALQIINLTCTKGPWYNVLEPMWSIQTERDPKRHAQRRRVWDRGFSVKALRNYEPRVALYTDKLLRRIEAGKGQRFDASAWFNFYSFDVMGDLSFGKSFGMLDSGIVHYYMKSLHEFMYVIGACGHIMWIYSLFKRLPALNSEYLRFQAWVKTQVLQRIQSPPQVPDVFTWVLDDYNAIAQPTEEETLNVFGDATTISIAGSDTTAATLSCLFMELALQPQAVRLVQEEIDEYFRLHQEPEHAALSRLKYLQACIDEALRLYPAVPSGVQRITPAEGLQVGQTFIPGDTIVQVPTYTLHRDERNFTHPDEFIPERWTTRPELIKNGSAFAPFSVGPYNCVGKQLGLMELRYVTSQILHWYDIALAPGQTKGAFLDGLVDGFTLACPKLELIFTPRTVK